jgi:FkbM family methyltransferase
MGATRRAKELVKDAFPSLWLRWHLMRRPKSAEQELTALDKIVPKGAVTVDVGANCGLYTRELARLSRKVHAFEPSHKMADLLRQTSAPNVCVHEMALSNKSGEADLLVPQDDDRLIFGLASLESGVADQSRKMVSMKVATERLESVIDEDVAFVKIDVEGHELNVLDGASGLLEKYQPVCLVEAEDRHRPQATSKVFDFFQQRAYRGFFLKDGVVTPVEEFDADAMQDVDALLPNGGRKPGQIYVNNFFFFPRHIDGESVLNG